MLSAQLHKLLICFAFGMVSCFGSYKEKIRIDGSSTLFPLSEAVAEEFRKLNSEVKITVGVSGTSGGFRKFIRNEIDIADASRKMNAMEMEECKKNNITFLELPVSKDGIVIAVHPSNDFLQYLTVNELKKLWEPSAQNKINYWSQINPDWPKKKIQLFGAGTSSGSFDFFSSKIVGIKKASRGDYTASEDDNFLVQGVAGAKYAIGYFGYSYYIENAEKLKLIPIDDGIDNNGQGPILPQKTTIRNNTYQPLTRTEYIYINKKSLTKKVVRDFCLYYIHIAPSLLEEIGGIPLEPSEYSKNKKLLNRL
jgi:phosphate transport system substrate-binding protein